MTDLSMAEISKGVWVPRGLSRRPAGGVINPEDEDEDHAPTFKEMVREAGSWGLGEPVRPLEPVAAGTHAGATMPPKLAPAPAGEDGYYSQEAMAERAARGLPRREAGATTEWNDVPDTTQPPRQAVFNCVKRYRFTKAWDKLIIEVELMSGTTLRHIVKLSQVKGILTKGHTCSYAEGQRPEKEVIIDLRAITCPGYAPEQLKFKLSGDENALAFQMALMDAL